MCLLWAGRPGSSESRGTASVFRSSQPGWHRLEDVSVRGYSGGIESCGSTMGVTNSAGDHPRKPHSNMTFKRGLEKWSNEAGIGRYRHPWGKEQLLKIKVPSLKGLMSTRVWSCAPAVLSWVCPLPHPRHLVAFPHPSLPSLVNRNFLGGGR